MPIIYSKDGTPYFEDPLTYEEQRLKDEAEEQRLLGEAAKKA